MTDVFAQRTCIGQENCFQTHTHQFPGTWHIQLRISDPCFPYDLKKKKGKDFLGYGMYGGFLPKVFLEMAWKR